MSGPVGCALCSGCSQAAVKPPKRQGDPMHGAFVCHYVSTPGSRGEPYQCGLWLNFSSSRISRFSSFNENHTNTLICSSFSQDLDPALISRFSTSVNFGLPNESCR